jgi:hypothetical protein
MLTNSAAILGNSIQMKAEILPDIGQMLLFLMRVTNGFAQ